MNTSTKPTRRGRRPAAGTPPTPPGGPGHWQFLRHYLEMVAAMLVGMVAPAVALVPLRWLGVITSDAQLLLKHLAMFLVMLRRRAEYGGPSHG